MKSFVYQRGNCWATAIQSMKWHGLDKNMGTRSVIGVVIQIVAYITYKP